MNIDRRSFLVGGGAFALAAGCKSYEFFGSPELTFGVLSDIHLTTPNSCRLLERSFRQLKRRGVDAVVIPGDLTDWGIERSLVFLKRTWDRVFGGTEVVPLFCTGNHDFEGWRYGDMEMEMLANGYSAEDGLEKLGLAKCWESAFGEPYSPVRVRTVKGYDFVSGEYKGYERLGTFMEMNDGRFRSGKPFFYFQHLPFKNTTADSHGWADDGSVAPVLARYPNCVAFTGHTHRPFADERSIWQDDFTVVSTPSLSYACLPNDPVHENGGGPRDGTAKQTMEMIPTRRDLRGGQGFVVDVWRDRIVIERHDFEEDDCDAPAWVVPLPSCQGERPCSYASRAETEPVPCFPASATLALSTRNTENRRGHWAVVLDCRFPTATMPTGSRVFDYEIAAVTADGKRPLVKYFFSPAYAKMAKFEPAEQRFWFDVAELPQGIDYTIEVCARNCFGKRSAPLVSDIWHGTVST